MYTYIYIYIYLCIHIRTLSVYIYLSLSIYIYIHIHICIYIHTCIIYMHIHIHIHIHIYIYTYIHTYNTCTGVRPQSSQDYVRSCIAIPFYASILLHIYPSIFVSILAQDTGGPSKGGFLNNRLLSYTDLYLCNEIDGVYEHLSIIHEHHRLFRTPPLLGRPVLRQLSYCIPFMHRQ